MDEESRMFNEKIQNDDNELKNDSFEENSSDNQPSDDEKNGEKM